jgi:hypothetical protein
VGSRELAEQLLQYRPLAIIERGEQIVVRGAG